LRKKLLYVFLLILSLIAILFTANYFYVKHVSCAQFLGVKKIACDIRAFVSEKKPSNSNIEFEVEPHLYSFLFDDEYKNANVFYEEGNTIIRFSSGWGSNRPTIKSVVERNNNITIYISEDKNDIGRIIQVVLQGKHEDIEIKDLIGNDYYVIYSN